MIPCQKDPTPFTFLWRPKQYIRVNQDSVQFIGTCNYKIHLPPFIYFAKSTAFYYQTRSDEIYAIYKPFSTHKYIMNTEYQLIGAIDDVLILIENINECSEYLNVHFYLNGISIYLFKSKIKQENFHSVKIEDKNFYENNDVINTNVEILNKINLGINLQKRKNDNENTANLHKENTHEYLNSENLENMQKEKAHKYFNTENENIENMYKEQIHKYSNIDNFNNTNTFQKEKNNSLILDYIIDEEKFIWFEESVVYIFTVDNNTISVNKVLDLLDMSSINSSLPFSGGYTQEYYQQSQLQQIPKTDARFNTIQFYGKFWLLDNHLFYKSKYLGAVTGKLPCALFFDVLYELRSVDLFVTLQTCIQRKLSPLYALSMHEFDAYYKNIIESFITYKYLKTDNFCKYARDVLLALNHNKSLDSLLIRVILEPRNTISLAEPVFKFTDNLKKHVIQNKTGNEQIRHKIVFNTIKHINQIFDKQENTNLDKLIEFNNSGKLIEFDNSGKLIKFNNSGFYVDSNDKEINVENALINISQKQKTLIKTNFDHFRDIITRNETNDPGIINPFLLMRDDPNVLLLHLFPDKRINAVSSLLDSNEKISIDYDEEDVEKKRETAFITRKIANLGSSYFNYAVNSTENLNIAKIVFEIDRNSKHEVKYDNHLFSWSSFFQTVNLCLSIKYINENQIFNQRKNTTNFDTETILNKFYNQNISKYAYAGAIFAVGMLKDLSMQMFYKILKKQCEIEMFAAFIGIGMSKIKTKDKEIAKICYTHIENATGESKIAAFLCLSLLYKKCNNLKLINLLKQEINKFNQEYNHTIKFNAFKHNGTYRMFLTICLTIATSDIFYNIDLQDSYCDLIFKGFKAVDTNTTTLKHKLMRKSNCNLYEYLYSELFINLCDLRCISNVLCCEIEPKIYELLNLNICEYKEKNNYAEKCYRLAGKIFYVAIASLIESNNSKDFIKAENQKTVIKNLQNISDTVLQSINEQSSSKSENSQNNKKSKTDDSDEKTNTHVNFINAKFLKLLLKTEQILENSISENKEHLLILFESLILSLCIINNGTCDLKLITILRRIIKKTENTKYLNPVETFCTHLNTTVKQFGLNYGELIFYKQCLGLLCAGKGTMKLKIDKESIFHLIISFMQPYSITSSDNDYFNIFRYFLIYDLKISKPFYDKFTTETNKIKNDEQFYENLEINKIKNDEQFYENLEINKKLAYLELFANYFENNENRIIYDEYKKFYCKLAKEK